MGQSVNGESRGEARGRETGLEKGPGLLHRMSRAKMHEVSYLNTSEPIHMQYLKGFVVNDGPCPLAYPSYSQPSSHKFQSVASKIAHAYLKLQRDGVFYSEMVDMKSYLSNLQWKMREMEKRSEIGTKSIKKRERFSNCA